MIRTVDWSSMDCFWWTGILTVNLPALVLSPWLDPRYAFASSSWFIWSHDRLGQLLLKQILLSFLITCTCNGADFYIACILSVFVSIVNVSISYSNLQLLFLCSTVSVSCRYLYEESIQTRGWRYIVQERCDYLFWNSSSMMQTTSRRQFLLDWEVN